MFELIKLFLFVFKKDNFRVATLREDGLLIVYIACDINRKRK